MSVKDNKDPDKKFQSSDQENSFECNDKYKVLLEGGLVAYVALSPDCIVEEANDAFAQSIGYSPSDLIQKSFGNFINSNDFEVLQKKLATGRSKTLAFTLPVLSYDGTVIHAHLSGKAIQCKETSRKRYYFVFTDITENINNQEKLKEQNRNLKLKDELLTVKENELKSQNAKLQQLNKTLTDHYRNFEDLNIRIVDNEMRLQHAFSAVNDGVWDWNLVTGEIYYTDRFFTMLGYDPFDFPHTIESWKNLLHPDDANKFMQLLDDTSKGIRHEFSVECKMCTINGNYRWILSRGKLVNQDNSTSQLRILGTQVDITSQKETELLLKTNEAELKRRNEVYAALNKKLEESNIKINRFNRQLKDKQLYLDSVFKTVPACIGLISDRIILFANDYCSLMTGYDMSEIIGHNTKFLYPNDEEYDRISKILYSDSPNELTKSVDTVWKMKNGTLIDVYITVTRIEIESPSTYSFSALDVTAMKVYEEELVKSKDQAEKAERLKTVFLSNMSHELRTPMNGIVGFAEMLQSQVNQTKREQYLKIIVNSSKQLLKIISDLVDISKIETGEIETFETSVSIRNLLKELYDSYRSYMENRNKASILLEYDCPLDKQNDLILTDVNKLRQVLVNLLNNAVKFTDSGCIKFGCEKKDGLLEFYVTDTGIGIEPDENEVIFECFRQTESPTRKKYGGNGLGLAISKGFVKILGGSIRVSSEKNKGSSFFFTIPFKQEVFEIAEEETFDTNQLSNLWKKHHILIVEDDLTCLTLIDEMLTDTSIRISHAMTGLEAVKFCRKDSSINVVLMDMRLPEMDGYEATKRIKEFRPNLNIIAQTAHALTEDRKKCMNAGCNEYLSKPLIYEELMDTLSKFLNQ